MQKNMHVLTYQVKIIQVEMLKMLSSPLLLARIIPYSFKPDNTLDSIMNTTTTTTT